MQLEPDNPLMRKKKTPEELAKEAEEADQDELTSKSATNQTFQTVSQQLFTKTDTHAQLDDCRVEEHARDPGE